MKSAEKFFLWSLKEAATPTVERLLKEKRISETFSLRIVTVQQAERLLFMYNWEEKL